MADFDFKQLGRASGRVASSWLRRERGADYEELLAQLDACIKADYAKWMTTILKNFSLDVDIGLGAPQHDLVTYAVEQLSRNSSARKVEKLRDLARQLPEEIFFLLLADYASRTDDSDGVRKAWDAHLDPSSGPRVILKKFSDASRGGQARVQNKDRDKRVRMRFEELRRQGKPPSTCIAILSRELERSDRRVRQILKESEGR